MSLFRYNINYINSGSGFASKYIVSSNVRVILRIDVRVTSLDTYIFMRRTIKLSLTWDNKIQ